MQPDISTFFATLLTPFLTIILYSWFFRCPQMGLERHRARAKDDHDLLNSENDELHRKIEELKQDIVSAVQEQSHLRHLTCLLLDDSTCFLHYHSSRAWPAMKPIILNVYSWEYSTFDVEHNFCISPSDRFFCHCPIVETLTQFGMFWSFSTSEIEWGSPGSCQPQIQHRTEHTEDGQLQVGFHARLRESLQGQTSNRGSKIFCLKTSSCFKILNSDGSLLVTL